MVHARGAGSAARSQCCIIKTSGTYFATVTRVPAGILILTRAATVTHSSSRPFLARWTTGTFVGSICWTRNSRFRCTTGSRTFTGVHITIHLSGICLVVPCWTSFAACAGHSTNFDGIRLTDTVLTRRSSNRSGSGIVLASTAYFAVTRCVLADHIVVFTLSTVYAIVCALSRGCVVLAGTASSARCNSRNDTQSNSGRPSTSNASFA